MNAHFKGYMDEHACINGDLTTFNGFQCIEHHMNTYISISEMPYGVIIKNLDNILLYNMTIIVYLLICFNIFFLWLGLKMKVLRKQFSSSIFLTLQNYIFSFIVLNSSLTFIWIDLLNILDLNIKSQKRYKKLSTFY